MTSDTPSLASPQPDLQPFTFRSGGKTEILLHGVDIASDLVGVQIVAEANDVPEVYLKLSKRVTNHTVFEGLAHVVIGVQPEPGPAAAAFLAAIDAETLQKAALNRHDLGHGPHATTQAILDQLTEWANGGS